MDTAKVKIANIVSSYIENHSEEFKLLREANEMTRKMIREKTYATEGSDMVPMYQTSERMQTAIATMLNIDEATWFKSREGGRWFIRTYPVFSLQNY
jgi:hypothetical protein